MFYVNVALKHKIYPGLQLSFGHEFLCTVLSFLLSIMGDHFPSFIPCFFKEFNLNDFLESIDKAEKLLNAMIAEVRYHIQSLSQSSCSSFAII